MQIRIRPFSRIASETVYPQKNHMIETFVFIRILNPILMKKYLFLGKNLRFGASIDHQI